MPLGKNNPIRLQTMTNTRTQDIEATTEQIISCFEKGADFVRISIPSLADVEALKEIELKVKNILFDKPLIADIHFNSKIAYETCGIVQKIRINPGNFVDKKTKQNKILTKKEYNAELQKIEEKLKPLIEKCKKTNTAIRIGTNHGSLSDRIISKYGNTTKGLVEATIEYLEICQKYNFQNIVVSIKASNPTIMVQANRLLSHEMQKRKMNYPIHLGVTEAGNGIEGRIKSALGIGALLIDGIGDTIRVSLTEKPENELPVATKIVKHIKNIASAEKLPEIDKLFFNPYQYERRQSYQIKNIGGNTAPIVVINSINKTIEYSEYLPDYILSSKAEAGEYVLDNIPIILNFNEWDENLNYTPILTTEEYTKQAEKLNFCFIQANYKELNKKLFEKISKYKNAVFIAYTKSKNKKGEIRLFYNELYKNNCQAPVIIKFDYNGTDKEDLAIKAAIDYSTFLIDGLADGIYINTCSEIEQSYVIDISFEILQAAHRRITKTEFISCPSCGRTLFDLEEVTEKIKKSLGHLKGLKIAVMGCIVNGPGEVADADYGYIGSGKNKVSLFKGKKLVKKDITENKAVEELIKIIKQNNDWTEP